MKAKGSCCSCFSFLRKRKDKRLKELTKSQEAESPQVLLKVAQSSVVAPRQISSLGFRVNANTTTDNLPQMNYRSTIITRNPNKDFTFSRSFPKGFQLDLSSIPSIENSQQLSSDRVFDEIQIRPQTSATPAFKTTPQLQFDNRQNRPGLPALKPITPARFSRKKYNRSINPEI